MARHVLRSWEIALEHVRRAEHQLAVNSTEATASHAKQAGECLERACGELGVGSRHAISRAMTELWRAIPVIHLCPGGARAAVLVGRALQELTDPYDTPWSKEKEAYRVNSLA